MTNSARARAARLTFLCQKCGGFCAPEWEPTAQIRMAANLHVVAPASFHPGTAVTAPAIPSDPHYKLLEDKECMSCHTITADADLAPSFKGLYGRTQKMTDGSVVKVDDAYLREAILDRDHTIVDGYDDLMPEPVLTDEELEQIIQYLKTLK